jgi:hypothetical protein
MDHYEAALKLKEDQHRLHMRKEGLHLCSDLTLDLMHNHPDIFTFGENKGNVTIDGNTWTVRGIYWEDSDNPAPNLITYLGQPGMALKKRSEVSPMKWESTKEMNRRQVKVSCHYSTPFPERTITPASK